MINIFCNLAILSQSIVNPNIHIPLHVADRIHPQSNYVCTRSVRLTVSRTHHLQFVLGQVTDHNGVECHVRRRQDVFTN